MTHKDVEFKQGMVIAFGFNYNGGEPKEIIVDTITSVHDEQLLVHFNYGHRSLGEYVKKENVIGIGDHEKGTEKIKGWSGKYVILNRKLYEKLNPKD